MIGNEEHIRDSEWEGEAGNERQGREALID